MLLFPRVIATLFWLANLGAAVLLYSAQLAAQPRYTTVYRADPRPPAEVFQYGFSSQGRQLSLLDHVFGGACDAEGLDDRSAWVGTSGNPQHARAFAYRSLDNNRAAPGHGSSARVWIYTIRTDNTYLETDAVFQQVIAAGNRSQQGYSGHLALRMRALVNSIAAQERQDVVTRRVAPENIVEARAYTAQFHGDGTIRNFSESQITTHNPRFQPPASVMTNEVENLQELVPGHNLFHYTRQLESCSQACDGASASSSQRIRRSALLGEGHRCAAGHSFAWMFMGGGD